MSLLILLVHNWNNGFFYSGMMHYYCKITKSLKTWVQILSAKFVERVLLCCVPKVTSTTMQNSSNSTTIVYSKLNISNNPFRLEIF